ncbi:MAG TPA: glutathione S-transferase family protein [Candidatus Paceibacterota bacterium]|nr:glutathione S-transferase family protein [Candidatus Paceibacterota bacterium]
MESTPILYTRPGCPFSAKVLLEAAILGVELDERSTKDPLVLEELIEKGGKNQTPFLLDVEREISLYESDAIMQYLHERFG